MNRSRPPSSARWPGTVSRTVMLGVAGAIGLAGCGSAPDAGGGGRVYFSESRNRAYEIGSSGARLDQLDERVSFGSIGDILATPSGYFVADGRDPRIVLLDRNLDPVRTMGREGEGPGEYRSPNRLVRADDRILVLDGGNGRVAYLTPDGDFVASQTVPGIVNDVALHPELGLLVAGNAFPDHYLARVTAEGHTAFGEIPGELRVDAEGPFQWPLHLVAVTADGTIHVVDGNQIALVSYSPGGDLAGTMFLPEEMRARELKEKRDFIEEIEEHIGRNRVVGAPIVTELKPLGDGRLFAEVTSENANGVIAKGLVLDLERREAIPLVFPAGREDRKWMLGSRIFLDGLDRLVLKEPVGNVGLSTAPIRLVDRDG